MMFTNQDPQVIQFLSRQLSSWTPYQHLLQPDEGQVLWRVIRDDEEKGDRS
jgi:hypothetical protein